MSKQLVFTRKHSPQEKIKTFVNKYQLKCSYKDKHESIYLNEHIIMSVTKRITWILITGQDNHPNIETDINTFFKKERYEYEKNKRKHNKNRLYSKK